MQVSDKEAELVALEAKAASLRHVVNSMASGAVLGVTTTAGMPQGKRSMTGSEPAAAK